ncbi:MAG TPA: hypothetical protein VER35_00105 [Candidatus Limnocylindrales bacterium]|nr:hypothetical protein [Candidatus Limnocylindrales bacterium]
MLILLLVMFSGCVDQIAGRFQQVQVVFVNVTVGEENNTPIIQNITAKGGMIPKLYAPGNVFPNKFPAIFAEVLQVYNASNPRTYRTISMSSGQPFNGSGTYTFTVQLAENVLNKSQPISVYSEILDNQSKRPSRAKVLLDWTEE